jgi:hypothetical protein
MESGRTGRIDWRKLRQAWRDEGANFTDGSSEALWRSG